MKYLGKIQFGESMYVFYSGCRDEKAGKFAQKGKRYFGFTKFKKASDGCFEAVKRENISSAGINTCKTISKALYYAQTPTGKVGLAGITAFAAGMGFWRLCTHLKKNKDANSNIQQDNTDQ